MNAATALVTGLEASPQLAENAVRQALTNAGLDRANGVILFLSRDFSRQLAQSVLAAARAAGCLQVVGMTAHGLFTETGWVLDQPAAAALVLGGSFSLAPNGDGPLLSFADASSLPPDWLYAPPRIGLLHSSGLAWQQARSNEDGRSETVIAGATCSIAVSPGLRVLGEALSITEMRGNNLVRLGEHSAVASLTRLLPAELRQRSTLPIHLLGALPNGKTDSPAILLLSANTDGSITLSQPLKPGDTLIWVIRQPLAAESDMRRALASAAAQIPKPAFGIQCSCIGRGPLFYCGDDHDLTAWRERFPGVPLIGAYGSGQLAPHGEANQLWQNTVVTALFGETHV
ncbi:MAG: hypothetical protein H6R18_1202 [Proteobacteria bacterium]|nr:hypothetical protein [Pseudomonadota bacterium]